jgi:hypothetical protein
MGLDMYLYARQYVPQKNWSADSEPITNPIFEAVNNLLDNNLPAPDFGGMYIEQQVAYWRKANAIHGWFVRELANNVDECQDIYVRRDDLVTLRDLCVQVLANRSQALPNTEQRTIELDGSNLSDEAVVTSIVDRMKAESLKRNTNTIVTEDDPLPPTAGFFFGSSEKDEWYYRDLEDTVDQINSILAATQDGDYSFSYRASW